MTRKNTPAKTQELRREERPEFLALLSELPTDLPPAELERIAAEAKAVFNDAVRAADAARVDLALMGWDAVVYRLNGDSFWGCAATDGPQTRLLAQLAAPPGQVPAWGQDGEWFMEVQGLRLWARVDNGGMMAAVHLNAVDVDQPFVSPTGHRAFFIDPRQCLGQAFGVAVRLEIERQLRDDQDWQLVAIKDQCPALPAWLAPALEGVTRDGQQALALSGRPPVERPVPAPEEPKAPMSNADRQREFRKRQKEKREQAKAEGRRTFELSAADLGRLWLAMNTYIAFEKPLDWEVEGFRELAGRLFAHEHAAYVERLGLEAEGVHNLNKQRDKQAKQGWDAYHDERKQNRGLGQKLFDAQEENRRLKAALAEIGAELGGVPTAPSAPAVDAAALQAEIERLRAQLDKQHNAHVDTTAELGRALRVTQAMQERLQAAGLPHDYRQYLGQ